MRRLKESEWIELNAEHIEAIQKEIVAFLNTKGGTLYIGINEAGEILGLKNLEITFKEVKDKMISAIQPDITHYVHFKKLEVGKKPIIEIDIEQGHARPYFLKDYGLTPQGVYHRQRTPATQTEIIQMIAQTDGPSFEKRRSLYQTLTFNALKHYSKDVLLNQEQMQEIGFVNQEMLYTNLAFLLSDQCDYQISVALFENEEKKEQRIFTGSLIKQYNEVSQYLIECLKGQYKESCLKEIILNALVHRDYLIKHAIQITIDENCLEMISIGGLLSQVTVQDIQYGLSISRNPNLMQFFAQLNLTHAQGIGLRKILRAYYLLDKQPEMIATKQLFKVTLPNLTSCKEKRLPNKAKPSDRTLLGEKDYRILKLIQIKGPISRAEIEKVVQLSTYTVRRILKNLKEEELIYSIGKGKAIKYKVKINI